MEAYRGLGQEWKGDIKWEKPGQARRTSWNAAVWTRTSIFISTIIKHPPSMSQVTDPLVHLDQDLKKLKGEIQQDLEDPQACLLSPPIRWAYREATTSRSWTVPVCLWTGHRFLLPSKSHVNSSWAQPWPRKKSREVNPGKRSFAWAAWHSPYPQLLRKQREKIQITNIKIERGDITTEFIDT